MNDKMVTAALLNSIGPNDKIDKLKEIWCKNLGLKSIDCDYTIQIPRDIRNLLNFENQDLKLTYIDFMKFIYAIVSNKNPDVVNDNILIFTHIKDLFENTDNIIVDDFSDSKNIYYDVSRQISFEYYLDMKCMIKATYFDYGSWQFNCYNLETTHLSKFVFRKNNNGIFEKISISKLERINQAFNTIKRRKNEIRCNG